MTVIELINTLKVMPHNAQVYIDPTDEIFTRTPRPEMEWNDNAGNYLVVL